MEHEMAGDPMSDLKWTRKTTGKIARQLARLNIRVSPKTVGRLLRDMGFSLRVNHKRLESGNAHPPPRKVRNRQFRYLNRMRRDFARRHCPILSVDTKKKEMVGRFKNNGVCWEKQAQPVNDHDFRSDALGMAVPYGLLDILANRGFVVVGMSADTPAFAVDALICWWKQRGSKDYPKAKELLILADCGGANSARSRVWKYLLATRLCEPHQLSVTVCHYPPGASKWNPIEHRLFSHLTKHWAGKPLETYETVLNYIRRTQTAAGLRVQARLTRKRYEKGQTVSDLQLSQINLRRHPTLPDWNYTISPRKL
jgi:Rhodopirellula transposase DDE domain